FRDWLVSDLGQALINAFRLNGEQLFIANAQSE
ncbi:tungsten ABC transporter substrate-binding protein, partial [Vibrio campbellii]